MKTRTVVLGGLIGAVVLFMGYGYSSAQSGSAPLTPTMGILSIRVIFRDCKVNIRYRDKAIAEQNIENAEMEMLQKETESMEAGLKALIPGSSDHMKQYHELLQKQASFEAVKQFKSQSRVLKDRKWTGELYKEVLRITKELAKQKGLSVVFEVDEPEFPMANTDELMMALQTHKVLYSDGCLDLTADVLVALDKIESQFKL